MKLKNIILLAFFIGFITSCDVTDKEPIDSLTDKSYWRTVDDLKLYAHGLYNNLSSPSVNLDNVSDNCVTTNYSTYLYDELTVPSTASQAGWTWDNIRACNFFLQRYQAVTGIEESINKYVAEVRFFRGLDYFHKIKRFGDVPYYEKDLQTDDTDELYKARDSKDYVLEKVIEDMEFAILWLPEYGQQESGRLTKDAARTQLARIALYYGTYKKYHNETTSPTADQLLRKAADLTQEIIESGNYEIVKGSDSGSGQVPFTNYPLYYSNQFVQEDLTANKEAILIREYKKGLLTHETGRQAGSNGTGLSKDFVESFLCIDGKPISVSDKYLGDETLDIEIKNRDPRMYQVIDNWNKPYTVINNERQVNELQSVDANVAVTGYPCVKYRSPLQEQWEARQTTYDWFVYRYAEVLLIHAEAKEELGESSQEILDKTINKLRNRVEMPHLTMNPVEDLNPIDYGYSISPLLYEIRRERRIELISEGFRLDDIKRWNATKLFENPKTILGIRITEPVAKLYGDNNITFGGEDGRPVVEYNGKVYLKQYASKSINDPAMKEWSKNDRRWYWPLPTNELVLNENLKQNPGW